MAEGHPVYPIYHIKWSWPEEGKYCKDGRNSSSSHFMLREESDEEIARIVRETRLSIAEDKDVDSCDVQYEVKLVRHEEWCLTWFSHYTFDIGQSDQEALDSFERYVRRVEHHNRVTPCFVGEGKDRFPVDDVCLMGAEDRWRWTARAAGQSILGCGDETSKPPCRCEGCKKRGVLTIDH